MRKPILGHNLNSLYNLVKGAALMVLLFTTAQVTAQVDCGTTMACNDGVQVSLDDACQADIAVDMVLEDPLYDPSEYDVEVRMLDGTIIPGATVNYSHVNMTLEVRVTLIECGNSCWGYITVEDKLPPFVELCEDYEVECDDNTAPGVIVPFPTATDACSSVERDYIDMEVVGECSDAYAKTITRTWTFTDEQGNEAECEQVINVLRADIMSIAFPPNYDDIELPSFDCGDVTNLLPNGAPSPDVTGRPEGTSCPNIQVYYEDVIFDICGESKKILRRWLVIDWCTGQERTENQTIKILDEQAPICTTQPDFIDEIPTDPGVCTGTYDVPPPIVIYECSDYDYYVSYKLRDENGDPFDEPIQDNVTRNADGTYTITDLPQDTSWIIYTLTDACGNVSECFTEVFVSDQESPTPVCEGYTVVGLEDQGWADLFATSIDDGSYDNCEVVRFEVRRESTPCGFSSDLSFGEKVNFCCEDVSAGYIKVVMRAFDAAGNFNDCIVNVNVQDKINPIIECPSDVTIQCTSDYEDLSLTGEPVATDNCSVEVSKVDQVNLNDCGLGSIRRTWTATDPQGRKATCLQIITVADSNPFKGSDIGWPSNREVSGCDVDDVSPEALNSFPILSNTDCADIAMSYEDDVFYNTPEYCIKVLRHWRVVNWCDTDPQNPDYYEYTQKIGIYNTAKPVITSDCTNKSIDADPGSCEGTINETLTATDDCTPGALLKYSYTIDYNNNGTIDETGNGKVINGTYPSGVHRITWEVEDACDNVSSCSYTVSINDNKAPTPICLGSVTWGLDSEGKAEIWASDFDLKSEDSCDDSDQLTFSFDEAGQQQVLEFTCADVPNGIAESIILRMYVHDTDGNFEYCEVELILQDSDLNDACEDMPGVMGRIQGTITTTANEMIDDIEVALQDMDLLSADHDMTSDGKYSFNDVEYYNEYHIAPSKNDDVRNGVNTLDLVKIQRHILELEEFDNPYKIIAADINNDERLSAADLLALRKVILGVSDQYPNNESWRFVPSTYEFEDESIPFGFPEEIEIEQFYYNNDRADFTAIKVGDIDNSVDLGNGLVAQGGSTAAMAAIAPNFDAGEIFTVDFTANELKEIIGLQFTLDYDADALKYSTLKTGVLNLLPEHIAHSDGKLTISYNELEVQSFDNNDILFTLTFKSNVSGTIGDYISIVTDELDAQLYDADLHTHTLQLDVASANKSDGEQPKLQTVLYQNTPNPFTTNTEITFDLAVAGPVSLTVYDVAGREIHRLDDNMEAGSHSINVDFTNKNVSEGVLYYRLETKEYQATKKMVLIK